MTEPSAPDPDFPRLSVRPFPPYRYVHGFNAHPRLDETGHSYGEAEVDASQEVTLLLAGEWRACEQYRYGIDLYNHAYWWEAHEAWESVWLHTADDSPLRHLLQCLIQVSAAHFQQHAGIVNGVRRLLQRADSHRQQAVDLRPGLLGLDLCEWWQARVQPYFAGEQVAFPFLALNAD